MKIIKNLFLLVLISCLFLTSCEKSPATAKDFAAALDPNKFIINNIELDETEKALGITQYLRASTENDECRFQFIICETDEQAKNVYSTNFKDDIYTTGKDYTTIKDDISKENFDYIYATVENGILVTSRLGNTILAVSSESVYSKYIFNIIEDLGYDK